jgi:hypothetical protein
MPKNLDFLVAHLHEIATQESAKPLVQKTITTGIRTRDQHWTKAAEKYRKILLPDSAPPPAPIPLPAVLERIDMDWNPISFPTAPVGGSAHVTLFPDGKAVFTGHFHDSGFPSYNFSASFAIVGSKGTVFTMTHTGTLYGTVDPGLRDADWTEGSAHGALADAWRELSDGYTWNGSAGVNWTAQQTLDNAIAAVKAAAQIGGAFASVIALF